MMKKAGLFMMVSILCFLFAACGSESGGSFSSSNPSGSVIQPEEPNSNTDGFSEVEYGLINPAFVVVEDEEFLYYVNPSDDSNLYKKDKNTGKEEKLYTNRGGRIIYMALLDDKIYLTNDSRAEDTRLISVDKNTGATKEELPGINVGNFVISKNDIYYTVEFEDTVYHYDRVTERSTYIEELSFQNEVTYADGVFYYLDSENSNLMKYDCETQETIALAPPNVASGGRNRLHTAGGRLLLTNENGNEAAVYLYDAQTETFTSITSRSKWAKQEDDLVEIKLYGVNPEEFVLIESLQNAGNRKCQVVYYKNGETKILTQVQGNTSHEWCNFTSGKNLYFYYELYEEGNETLSPTLKIISL